MLLFSSRRSANTAASSLLAASLRMQSTTAAAETVAPAAAPAAAASSSPAAEAAKAAPSAAAPHQQWSVYRPPQWRSLGVTDHRKTREAQMERGSAIGTSDRKGYSATEKKAFFAKHGDGLVAVEYVLGKSADQIAAAEAMAAVPAPSAATTFFFHGNALGPRPLVVLDEVLPFTMAEKLFSAVSSSSGAAAANDDVAAALSPLARYESLLSQLNHAHGALSLPLVAPKGVSTAESIADPAAMPAVEKKLLLTKLADDVITMLDTMNIQFATIVARSTGALVAARLSLLYPERVGGLIICDTPLVTKSWVDNERSRKELLLAAEDVNVPRAELEFSARTLTEKSETEGDGLESNMAVPFVTAPSYAPAGAAAAAADAIAAFNKALYEQAIFDRSMVFPTEIRGCTLANSSEGADAFVAKANNRKSATDITVSRNAATAAKYLTSLCAEDEAGATAPIDVPVSFNSHNPVAMRPSRPDVYAAKTTPVTITEGLYRSNQAYLDPEALAAIRHPMLLVQPSGKVAADGNLHKNYFNLRKPTVIALGGAAPAEEGAAAAGKKDKGGKKEKGGDDKKGAAAAPAKAAAPAASSMFDAAVSSAFAKQVAAFTSRFELDISLAKRFEQQAADLLKNMNNSQSVNVASSDDKGDKKGKKKKDKK